MKYKNKIIKIRPQHGNTSKMVPAWNSWKMSISTNLEFFPSELLKMLEFLKGAKRRQFGKLQTFWPMTATGALWPANLTRQRCSSNAISMGTPWWHCLCQRMTRRERKLSQRKWKPKNGKIIKFKNKIKMRNWPFGISIQ